MNVDTKFCTACQAHRPLEGGAVKQTKTIKRWVCAGCLNRKGNSIYSKPKGGTVSEYR